MKLVRYGPAGKEKPGLIDADGKLRDLSRKVKRSSTDRRSPRRHWRNCASSTPRSCRWSRASRGSARASPTPPKFVAIGLNYIDHAKETGSPIPEYPIVFFKAETCIVGANDNVMLPPDSTHTDWEVELGVVIGRTARHVAAEGRAQVRRRLLRDQRRLRARIPAEAQRVAMEQGQGLRHLRSDRARGW